MDLGLTAEQKRVALNAAKSTARSEIYNILIRMGVDPDTFDPTAERETDMILVGEYQRLDALLASLELIEEKLADL
jgi:hypothetical protein